MKGHRVIVALGMVGLSLAACGGNGGSGDDTSEWVPAVGGTDIHDWDAEAWAKADPTTGCTDRLWHEVVFLVDNGGTNEAYSELEAMLGAENPEFQALPTLYAEMASAQADHGPDRARDHLHDMTAEWCGANT